jgi:hypothetical protein
VGVRLTDPRVREAGLIAGSGVAMFLIFLLIRTSLIDDAYITLSYAKNLGLHLHWGLIPQEVSNTATSPLNVLLLGALSAVTRIGGGVHPVLALGVLSIASAMVMAWGWVRVMRVWRLPLWVGALGVGVVVVNPFLLSAIGLEVLLVPTLLIVLLATAVEGRPGWFGLAAGLTLLGRLDLIVFVVAIAVATPVLRERWRRILVATALVAAPWFLFSWIALGSAIPDTLLIKTSQKAVFDFWTFTTGPVLYAERHHNVVPAAFAPALLGLFGLVAWLAVRAAVRREVARRLPPIGPAAALGVGGVAYYALLVLLGVPPYHWYYVPPLASLSMFFVVAAAVWLRRARDEVQLRPALPAALLALVALLTLANLARDVTQGVPWREPVISTNYATADAYARIGVELRKKVGGATVENLGEIGTLAYFCDCALVEQFSDRGYTMPLINQRIHDAGTLTRPLYELNYLWLDRDQKPRPHTYVLRHDYGLGSGPNVWQIHSPWSGPGRLTLLSTP